MNRRRSDYHHLLFSHPRALRFGRTQHTQRHTPEVGRDVDAEDVVRGDGHEEDQEHHLPIKSRTQDETETGKKQTPTEIMGRARGREGGRKGRGRKEGWKEWKDGRIEGQ